jgi:hypothetical protein
MFANNAEALLTFDKNLQYQQNQPFGKPCRFACIVAID